VVEDGPPAGAAQAFRATGIGFSYAIGTGTFAVFRDVSLAVPRGRTLALFGPNGTGKSTLMRALAGARIDSGRIEPPLNGSERPRIGYIPQNYARSFFPWATLETNILINLPDPVARWSANKAAIRDAHDALRLELDLHRRPGQCSGGMLQQAALIRALARRPDLLLADEPFSALDFDVAGRVREGFSQAIRDFKICAVATLHDLQDIIEVCDLVLAIPGRPYTTNPALSDHIQARLFENPERKRRNQHGADPGGAPSESPFIRAVSKALGVELP
jgi:NitT/TauT family transport system ATP-binding protein